MCWEGGGTRETAREQAAWQRAFGRHATRRSLCLPARGLVAAAPPAHPCGRSWAARSLQGRVAERPTVGSRPASEFMGVWEESRDPGGWARRAREGDCCRLRPGQAQHGSASGSGAQQLGGSPSITAESWMSRMALRGRTGARARARGSQVSRGPSAAQGRRARGAWVRAAPTFDSKAGAGRRLACAAARRSPTPGVDDVADHEALDGLVLGHHGAAGLAAHALDLCGGERVAGPGATARARSRPGLARTRRRPRPRGRAGCSQVLAPSSRGHGHQRACCGRGCACEDARAGRLRGAALRRRRRAAPAPPRLAAALGASPRPADNDAPLPRHLGELERPRGRPDRWRRASISLSRKEAESVPTERANW
jgi:hypothetical protein